MKVTNYQYNATDDGLQAFREIFTSRIGRLEPDAVYVAMIKWLADNMPGARCLDIGCGLGRFIQIVKPAVGGIIAIEPDKLRFATCFESHNGGNVSVLNTTSTDYKEEHPQDRFDIIVLSMVLQHVATGICDQILTDIRDMLADDGVAIIGTTQMLVERFAFQLEQSPHTVEEFDRYALDSAGQQFGIPVRYFSRESFSAAIDRAGLAIMQWGQFDFVRPARLSALANLLKVTEDEVREIGTSQYVIVMRR
jgi:SAM-dependent methyltransferase